MVAKYLNFFVGLRFWQIQIYFVLSEAKPYKINLYLPETQYKKFKVFCNHHCV